MEREDFNHSASKPPKYCFDKKWRTNNRERLSDDKGPTCPEGVLLGLDKIRKGKTAIHSIKIQEREKFLKI